MTSAARSRSRIDLRVLTGVRSGKTSYYPHYRRSAERMEAAVRSLDEISVALVRTVEGPRALLTAVLHAAAAHLRARWVVLAVADSALPDARPRFLALDDHGRLADDVEGLRAEALPWLQRLRSDPPESAEVDPSGVVVVPMMLDAVPVGGIVGRPLAEEFTEPLDLAVLRILVNQVAVALHNASLHRSSLALRTKADQLTIEATQRAADLAARNEELHSAQQQLLRARAREVLEEERRRIARELHDSVTQYVLSAGMVVDVARSRLEAANDADPEITQQLLAARDLTQHAVNQLRAAIYSLNRVSDTDVARLPRLLEQACALHSRPGLNVDLRLEGSPVRLPAFVEQSLARLAGEALFNVSQHGEATRCVVRLSYGATQVRLAVDDDGNGDPASLRTQLQVEAAGDVDGRHRGLVNMATRAHELGGTFRVRRSRLGGVQALVHIPTQDLAERETP